MGKNLKPGPRLHNLKGNFNVVGSQDGQADCAFRRNCCKRWTQSANSPTVTAGVDNEQKPSKEVWAMLLRDHLLKSRHGVPNWHPLGNRLRKTKNTCPQWGSSVTSRSYLAVSNVALGSFCELMQRFT